MKKKKKKVIERKKLSPKSVMAFKIVNRRGYAMTVLNMLCEGRTVAQAYDRLCKACRARGYDLPTDQLPEIR